MPLIVLTIVVIALMITALAVYLFMIGTLLSRTAGNLGDCLQNLTSIAGHAQAVGPGITRINRTGGELLSAMPLLLEDAAGVAAQTVPSAPAPPPSAVLSTAAAPAATSPVTPRPGVGYLDAPPATGLGYLDA